MEQREAGIKEQVSSAVVREIDRLAGDLAKCFEQYARLHPKPILIDGEEQFDDPAMTTCEEGVAQDKARAVARKIMRAADCEDHAGCLLCMG